MTSLSFLSILKTKKIINILNIQGNNMERKEIKARQKKLRSQIITIIDTTPNWCRLPDDAPEIQQVRELQKKINELGKMRQYKEN